MEDRYSTLSRLFFEVRSLIRERIPGSAQDPNSWLRLETLRFIDGRGGPSMHEVARFLRISAPSVSSLIAALEQAGLVRRVRAKDRRAVCLYVTPTGKRELRRAGATGNRAVRQVFSKLSKRDIQALSRLLERLVRRHKDEA